MRVTNPLHIGINIPLKNERNIYSFPVGITDSFKLLQKPSSLSIFQRLLHHSPSSSIVTRSSFPNCNLSPSNQVSLSPSLISHPSLCFGALISLSFSFLFFFSSISLFQCSYIFFFFSFLFFFFFFLKKKKIKNFNKNKILNLKESNL
jgi:hypothetical protein